MMKIKNLNESFRRLYEEACEDCEDELTFDDIEVDPSVEGELTEAKISPEDKHESDLSEYQKWVDYDMEKYHRISDITMKKIKKAGLSVVKDQYGEYEVIADRRSKKNESYLNGDEGQYYVYIDGVSGIDYSFDRKNDALKYAQDLFDNTESDIEILFVPEDGDYELVWSNGEFLDYEYN